MTRAKAPNAHVVWGKRSLAALGMAAGISACVQIGGIDEPILGDPNESGGAGGAGGSGGSGAAGGAGGAGGGSSGPCVPDSTRPCYSGAPTTVNIGNCKPGIETCLANGTGYGACEGEVLPMMEDCINVGDEDCDALADIDDPECACTMAGTVVACNTTMPGVCAAGMGVCAADGRSISNCAPTTVPSVENCVTPEDEDCDGSATACSGDPVWSYTPSGAPTSPNDDGIFAVAATPDGGFVIAGVVDGTLGADGFTVTAGKAYVAKLDNSGAVSWEKRYSAGTYAAARSIAADKNGTIVVGGQFSGNMDVEGVSLVSSTIDAFMVKLDLNGAASWVRSFIGLKTQTIRGVAIDPNGNIVVAGHTDDAVDFGNGMTTVPTLQDVFIASYGPDKSYRWHKLFVNAGVQYARAVTTTPNGDVVLLGDSDNSDVNLGGGTLLKGGNLDFFVGRFSSANGTHQWSKLFGKTSDQGGRGLAAATNGDIFITGTFSGSID